MQNVNNPFEVILTAFTWDYWLILGLAVIFTVVLYRIRQRAFQKSKGIVEGAKARIEENIDVAQKNIEVAKERLQVERELLALQQETNALLKQLLAKIENKT